MMDAKNPDDNSGCMFFFILFLVVVTGAITAMEIKSLRERIEVLEKAQNER